MPDNPTPFKPGDRVRVLRMAYPESIPVGTISDVTEIINDTVLVRIPGRIGTKAHKDAYSFLAEELELVRADTHEIPQPIARELLAALKALTADDSMWVKEHDDYRRAVRAIEAAETPVIPPDAPRWVWVDERWRVAVPLRGNAYLDWYVPNSGVCRASDFVGCPQAPCVPPAAPPGGV